MGIDVNGIRLLLLAKRLGANFKDVATIGRQGLHLTPQQLQKECADFDVSCDGKNNETFDYRYSESLFSLLGAQTTQSIDNSDYEKATIIHDMNNPLPAELKGKFSAVVDAGTLEHVFNYPVAVKNCMELLKNGGFFIQITPANNFMGHGFYQFSPELFFSVFAHENGFELIKLLICEIYEDSQWYEVSRPKGGNQGRVTLINHQPTYLMCIARRVDDKCEPFKTTPQQSDYVEAWYMSGLQRKKAIEKNHDMSIILQRIKLLFKVIPGLNNMVRHIRYLKKPIFHNRDYTPVDPLHII
jgi:SAM-dependent methyltransferase